MRRFLGAAFVIPLLALGLVMSAQQQAQQVSPKLKGIIDSMKENAATKQGLVSRTPQGTFYFKWIQNPPPGFEKAFFQLGELNKGTRFLSLKLVRRTSAGVELIVLNDTDMNSIPEDAYKATGRTLQDADRAISTSSDKLKIPVTPEMVSHWTAMLDELKWELKAN
jgi:hypothetical protein